MKKYTLALAFAVLVPFVSASAYEYAQAQNEYNTARQADTNYTKKASTMKKGGGYRNVITNNFYYNQQVQPPRPARQSSYTGYDNSGYYRNTANADYYNPDVDYKFDNDKKPKKTEMSRSSSERKFFLAHPFFQPLKGKFGSVTDVSYAHNGFNFDILNGSIYDVDVASPGYDTYEPFFNKVLLNPLSAKAETSQFVAKEDFSYGISDTLAIIGMFQYDHTKIAFKDWSNGDSGDSSSDSGLNIFGIGVQNRFIDSDKWIGMIAGFFQHQRDIANTFIGDLKIGHKIGRTTVYGLGRIGYSNLIKGDIYGMYVSDKDTEDYTMLSYRKDVKDILYYEGGMGVFSVLNKDFTLNGEVIYGHYDWHNQLGIKGALGWQPGSSFALNLYASTSLYDSAEGKHKTYMSYEINPDTTDLAGTLHENSKAFYTTGDYKIKDYNEWKVGLQAIFYF